MADCSYKTRVKAVSVSKEKSSPLTSENPLVVANFYEGAYGPTIILVLSSTEAATWLRQVFLGQMDRRNPRELSAEPEMRVNNVASLSLVTRMSEHDIKLKRVTDAVPVSFTVFGTQRGWQYVADLIKPFCNGQPGHQYFADLAGDDAVVEISFGESHVLAV